MTPVERLLAKCEAVTETGCWLWTASLNIGGYGNFWFNNAMSKAHRASWEIYRGPIPPCMCVCHKCDTRPCVNPDHLFLGTLDDNNKDREAKGRGVQLSGERSAMSKLTDAQVGVILTLPGTSRSIAEKYGVSDSTIGLIRKRKTWRHVA